MKRAVCFLLVASVLLPASRAAGQGGAAPKLKTDELDALWQELAGKDAAKAYRAIWRLVNAAEQSVPFLAGRLRKDIAPDSGRITRLVADLDAKRFGDRQRAMSELEKLGPLAKAALEQAHKANPSLEVRLRVEQLLEKISGLSMSAEDLRVWRALEVLEYIGDAAARRVLRGLADGAPGSTQTKEAKRALERLAKRPPATP